MTSTLVDTNIFIDVLGAADPHREWSLSAIETALDGGRIVVSAIVWAELAGPASSELDLSRWLSWLRPMREDLPFEAAFPAGKAHALYRRRGGQRERTLPDFLIGAHALVRGYRLLTREAARYRLYFPTLDIIAPETHP